MNSIAMQNPCKQCGRFMGGSGRCRQRDKGAVTRGLDVSLSQITDPVKHCNHSTPRNKLPGQNMSPLCDAGGGVKLRGNGFFGWGDSKLAPTTLSCWTARFRSMQKHNIPIPVYEDDNSRVHRAATATGIMPFWRIHTSGLAHKTPRYESS